ncbi:hypothetical protein LT493_31475 [Streptomyces tricolor]|nr:hypothetical protein [Streptomyces tricolor]
MKYIDEFNDPELARRLLDEIRATGHPALGPDGGLAAARPTPSSGTASTNS